MLDSSSLKRIDCSNVNIPEKRDNRKILTLEELLENFRKCTEEIKQVRITIFGRNHD
jgi:hypothetical protein